MILLHKLQRDSIFQVSVHFNFRSNCVGSFCIENNIPALKSTPRIKTKIKLTPINILKWKEKKLPVNACESKAQKPA